MPRGKDYFKPLQRTALGIGGLSLVTGVGASIASRAPAGTPSLTRGFATIASFAPIGVAVVGGHTVLQIIKPMRRRR